MYNLNAANMATVVFNLLTAVSVEISVMLLPYFFFNPYFFMYFEDCKHASLENLSLITFKLSVSLLNGKIKEQQHLSCNSKTNNHPNLTKKNNHIAPEMSSCYLRM